MVTRHELLSVTLNGESLNPSTFLGSLPPPFLRGGGSRSGGRAAGGAGEDSERSAGVGLGWGGWG
jgi:hypothetical protein